MEGIEYLEASKKVFTKLKACNHNAFEAQWEQYEQLQQKFTKQYGLEFNPTCGVISSVLSQEIIKVITKRDKPASGFLVYNSEDQSFTI